MTASTQSRVLLENVQVKQSGTYLCEVTVTPGYYALMQFANMTVVGEYSDLPNKRTGTITEFWEKNLDQCFVIIFEQ